MPALTRGAGVEAVEAMEELARTMLGAVDLQVGVGKAAGEAVG